MRTSEILRKYISQQKFTSNELYIMANKYFLHSWEIGDKDYRIIKIWDRLFAIEDLHKEEDTFGQPKEVFYKFIGE